MPENLQPFYHAKIVPALNRIQAKHGYLQRAALEQYAKENELPLYRLQEVASFFPHYRLNPPPRVSLHVCRDMTCHMNGSSRLLRRLAKNPTEGVEVHGASCLGRCDRAPAACVSVHTAAAHVTGSATANGSGNGNGTATGKPAVVVLGVADHGEQELYITRCTEEKLNKIVATALAGGKIVGDSDALQPDVGADASLQPPQQVPRYPAPDWMIDPYRPGPPDYAAVKKALALRRESLRKSAELLQTQFKWTESRAQQFRVAAERRTDVDFPIDKELADAVRAWQTEEDWAKAPGLGGWAESFFLELDSAHADLRGLGGAGIPATQKWKDVRDAVRTSRRRRDSDDRAFIVVNGDESEPGTFKDRELLLHFPHLVLEGLLLAAVATDASQGFIYIRHEFAEQIEACEKEIARAFGPTGPLAEGLGWPFLASVFVSPGGYICGEQSALIQAMSDHRGEPRNLPPKLETNGLQDQPTLVSNVETYAWVPFIYLKGGQTYADLGVNGSRGRRFFSISGDVNRPGVYEVPMGMTLRDLIYGEQYCRGVFKNLPLKAFAPSGPSGGFLPAKLAVPAKQPPRPPKDGVEDQAYKSKQKDYKRWQRFWTDFTARHKIDPAATEIDVLDLELELNVFRSLSPTQMLGAGLAVYAEGRCIANQAVNSLEFFRNESCGKCVPCRIGSQKMAILGGNLLERKISVAQWEEELLPLTKDLGDVMNLTSICGLGRSVPIPLKTVSDFFGKDLADYLREDDANDKPATADKSEFPSEVHG